VRDKVNLIPFLLVKGAFSDFCPSSGFFSLVSICTISCLLLVELISLVFFYSPHKARPPLSFFWLVLDYPLFS
jgi:hypothetical protein